MNIMVCVPTAEMTRYGVFYDFMNRLQLPKGTMISYARAQSPAATRNVMIKGALEREFTHLIFIDDDVLPPPDFVMKMAQHEDKDVVTALYLMRNHPHNPIIFDKVDSDARCLTHFLKDGETGLVPIAACGLGACIIKAEVFKALEYPWIRLGELDGENWTDDTGFFRRVNEKGFKMYCDLDIQVGHIGAAHIWPAYINGKWVTVYNTLGKESPSIPKAEPELVWNH